MFPKGHRQKKTAGESPKPRRPESSLMQDRSNRPVPADRYPVHRTLRRIIDTGVMLRTPVIPHCDRIIGPVKTHLEFRLLAMPDQVGEYRVTLGAMQIGDMRREVAVDEQALATRFRVRSHDRMFDGRCDFVEASDLFCRPFLFEKIGRHADRDVMNRRHIVEQRLHRFRQGVIGRVQVIPHRVAAGFRHVDRS